VAVGGAGLADIAPAATVTTDANNSVVRPT
jgi:hypothetical protein